MTLPSFLITFKEIQEMTKLPFKTNLINEKNLIGKEVHEVPWQDGIGELAIRLDNFT